MYLFSFYIFFVDRRCLLVNIIDSMVMLDDDDDEWRWWSSYRTHIHIHIHIIIRYYFYWSCTKMVRNGKYEKWGKRHENKNTIIIGWYYSMNIHSPFFPMNNCCCCCCWCWWCVSYPLFIFSYSYTCPCPLFLFDYR